MGFLKARSIASSRIVNTLTDSQIGEKLVISENSIKGHVSNILIKLHVTDRIQVPVYS